MHNLTLLFTLFANDLNKFNKLKRKAIRLIQYKGRDTTETIKETIGSKGYASGFEGLLSFLQILLPQSEVLEKAFRKEIPMYPPRALRELVANALIHQDFSITGMGPTIEIFCDRIEITNPGIPVIDTLRFIDHAPQSRNEILAYLMRRLKICEERGSGIDKVIFETEFHQLPPPDFIVGDNYLKVIVYGQKEFRNMDKNDRVRACYQHSCIKYITKKDMTNTTLRERFGIKDENYPMVSKIISDTLEKKLIKNKDESNTSRRYASYIPFWA